MKPFVIFWAGFLVVAVFGLLILPTADAANIPVDAITKTVAAQPAGFTRSVSFNCPANGTVTDMDTDSSVDVTCGDGFRVVSMETEETVKNTYICGGVGCTKANFTTTGLLRRVGAPNGSSFGGELRMTSNGTSNIKCIVDDATATTVWRVFCAQ